MRDAPPRPIERRTVRRVPDISVLDQPAWSALTGAHAHLAEGGDRVKRYRPDVSPILAVRDFADPDSWAELLAVAGPEALVPLTNLTPGDALPEDWSVEARLGGVQLLSTDRVVGAPDPEALVLGEADVPEMLALVDRTKPGPFEQNTRLMGTYLGIRVDGRLVAMAGERLKPAGFTEISAVCTDADVRGRGYATRLVLAVAHGIRERGEVPFMHASATNTGAISLYEHLGFFVRRSVDFAVVRTPAEVAS